MRKLLLLTVLFILVCMAPAFANDTGENLIEKAESGDVRGQKVLGSMYYLGQDVPRDYKKAFEWYEKAALQGDARAQGMLGLMYYFGQGVPQDYKKAFEWCEKAALQGDVGAQCLLGLMYSLGQGVPQDFVMAYAYLNIAASAGDAIIIEQRDLSQKEMTPAQIKKGQDLSRELFKKIEENKKAKGFE
jgi:TPR repeat protein